MEKRILISLVTTDFDFFLKNMFQSLVCQIKKFDSQRISLLLIDKSGKENEFPSDAKGYFDDIIYVSLQELGQLERMHGDLYELVNHPLDRDSVQKARLQMYMVLRHYKKIWKDAIVWQMDDDLLFEQIYYKQGEKMSVREIDYFSAVREYHATYPFVDAGIGQCAWIPPLPVLLYLKKQLCDIFKSKDAGLYKKYKHYYHDLYDTDAPPVLAQKLPVEKKIRMALKGEILTRPLIFEETKPLEFLEKTIYRGANFIVFNPEVVLIFPHFSFTFQTVLGRRSDMIHAWMLSQIGYELRGIDLPLIHNRRIGTFNATQLYKTYYADSLGAFAYRYLAGGASLVEARYALQLEHLQELSRVSRKLYEKHQIDLLSQLIQAHDDFYTEFSNLDKKYLFQELAHFKYKIHEQLKGKTISDFNYRT